MIDIDPVLPDTTIPVELAFPGCAPAQCSGCGQIMSWQTSVEDTWIWADQRGRTVVSGDEGEAITGYPSPYKILKDVGDRILAALTGPKGKRGPMPSDEECNLYSILVGDPLALGSRHVHRHDARCPHGKHVHDDMPWHCGEPMWLRPSGWHCRGGSSERIRSGSASGHGAVHPLPGRPPPRSPPPATKCDRVT